MPSQPNAPWYSIKNVGEIDTPALVIYPERALANIRTARQMVADVQLLRPHVKTHKSPDASRMLLAEGITRFKCATIAEAEMLASVGAPDVLLAYQPVGPKVQRLRALARMYPDTRLGCIVDDARAATEIARAFADQTVPFPVYLDINVGMNRTGVHAGEEALGLFHACTELKGISMVGLHAYDGHIQDGDIQTRTGRCHADFMPVLKLRDDLKRLGAGQLTIVAGGSPTFPIHAKQQDRECSPGTFIYWDKSYLDSMSDQPYVPAALVLTRVISRPTADTICLDLGHKSVAAEKDLHHRVHFLNASDAEVLSQSEEHLIIHPAGPEEAKVGDVFFGLPYHICPTCALYERAVTVVHGEAHGEWRIVARDRVINV